MVVVDGVYTCCCAEGSGSKGSYVYVFYGLFIPFRNLSQEVGGICGLYLFFYLHLSCCSWFECEWSLVTAAATRHGDYLNRMARVHACCEFIYTHTYIFIYIYMCVCVRGL
jgi:hypothetical protein